MYESIRGLQGSVNLLDFSSERFEEGITITFAHMAKGLEFDQVIVPLRTPKTIVPRWIEAYSILLVPVLCISFR